MLNNRCYSYSYNNCYHHVVFDYSEIIDFMKFIVLRKTRWDFFYLIYLHMLSQLFNIINIKTILTLCCVYI